MKKLSFQIIVFLIFSVTASFIFAAEEQGDAINITSDRMEAEKLKRLIVFKGNVVAKQKDMTINSDELQVHYDESGKDIEEVIAIGNVRIVQGDKTATAQRAVYYKIEEKVVLTGNARLNEASNFVEGESITVYVKTGRSIVEGSEKGRVKAHILSNSEGGILGETFSK